MLPPSENIDAAAVTVETTTANDVGRFDEIKQWQDSDIRVVSDVASIITIKASNVDPGEKKSRTKKMMSSTTSKEPFATPSLFALQGTVVDAFNKSLNFKERTHFGRISHMFEELMENADRESTGTFVSALKKGPGENVKISDWFEELTISQRKDAIVDYPLPESFVASRNMVQKVFRPIKPKNRFKTMVGIFKKDLKRFQKKYPDLLAMTIETLSAYAVIHFWNVCGQPLEESSSSVRTERTNGKTFTDQHADGNHSVVNVNGHRRPLTFTYKEFLTGFKGIPEDVISEKILRKYVFVGVLAKFIPSSVQQGEQDSVSVLPSQG